RGLVPQTHNTNDVTVATRNAQIFRWQPEISETAKLSRSPEREELVVSAAGLQEIRDFFEAIRASSRNRNRTAQRRLSPAQVDSQSGIPSYGIELGKHLAWTIDQHAGRLRIALDDRGQVRRNRIFFVQPEQQVESSRDQPSPAKTLVDAELSEIAEAEGPA